MNKESLLSSAVFDCLRNLPLEPYAMPSSIARERLPASASSGVTLFPIRCARPWGVKQTISCLFIRAIVWSWQDSRILVSSLPG